MWWSIHRQTCFLWSQFPHVHVGSFSPVVTLASRLLPAIPQVNVGVVLQGFHTLEENNARSAQRISCKLNYTKLRSVANQMKGVDQVVPLVPEL